MPAEGVPQVVDLATKIVRIRAAVGIHTLAMLLVMAAVAVIIFEKVGLAILRRAWVNLDLVWAGALVGAGIITLFV